MHKLVGVLDNYGGGGGAMITSITFISHFEG